MKVFKIFLSLFWVFFGLLFHTTVAQQVISGRVQVKGNNSLAFGVNVLVKNPDSQSTIAFGVANEEGKFSIKVASEKDSLLLMFRSMTIKEHKVLLPNKSQEIFVELEEGLQEIPEITVKALKNPVSLRNDTLSYSVENFVGGNDRVIADVIKKLPGVEVTESGRILYQNKPIQKFYIDGMDLLEGKYNLANKNLPANAVESVQILENHQPIRILDSLVATDRASLNLKLKRRNVWIGTGFAGLGASPFLNEAKFSPMTFRDGLQMLYNVQTNNTGKNIAQDLSVLTLDDLNERAGAQNTYRAWFGVPSLWSPSIKQERFLFNQSQIFSANVLKRNAKGVDVRANISYLHDSQRQLGGVSTTYFLPNDSIRIQEDHRNRYLVRDLDAELSWIKNEKKSYYKNRLKLDLQNNLELGQSQLNQINWNQRANLPFLGISNNYHGLKPVGKKLLDIKSDLGFRQTSQQFSVSPGSFEASLNEGQPYEQLVQSLDYRSLYANQSVGTTKGIGRFWTYINRVGLLYEFQSMGSGLNTVFEGNSENLGQPFANDLTYRRFKSYWNSQLNMKKENTNFEVSLPLAYTNILVEDQPLSFDAGVNRLIWEPQVYFRYQLSGKWNSSVRVQRKNEFKGINDIHFGFVLRDFRSFQQRATELPESLAHTVNYSLNYRDPIRNIYSTFTYSYTNSNFNTILESSVAPTGELVYAAINLNNRGENHSASLRTNHYITQLKTNLTFAGNYQHRFAQQVINGSLTDVVFDSYGFAGDVQYNASDVVNFTYKANLGFVNSNVAGRNTGLIRQLNHIATLDLFVGKNHSLLFLWELYDNKLSDRRVLTGFLDAQYRYKQKGKRWDLTLHAQNLLNNDSFGNFRSDSFLIRQESFLLRPRQVVASVNFSF